MLQEYTPEMIAEETLLAIRAVQPTKDRMKYFNVACEALVNENKGNLIQKLYEDMISKSNIDFGSIPTTRGDFTKFKDYQTVSEAIGILNKLFTGKTVPELEKTNHLFDMIISLRGDYEFGYKFEVEMIKISYCTAVVTLLDMVNLCIVAYVNYLKNTNNTTISFGKLKPKDLYFVQSADSFLALYNSGEWTKLMKTYRAEPNNLFGTTGKGKGLFNYRNGNGILSNINTFLEHSGAKDQ